MSRKKEKKSKDKCFACGDSCTAGNRDEWVELRYMGRKGRRVRICKKHDGVEKEFERQQKEG